MFIIIAFFILTAFCLTPVSVSAGESVTGSSSIFLTNPLGEGSTMQSFLISILNFVIKIGSVIVVLMIVFVGFKFVAAQGNESKIGEAKTMFLWTIIGALVLLGSKVIAVGICETTNALSTGGSIISCIF